MYQVDKIHLAKLHNDLIETNQVWFITYIGLIHYCLNKGKEDPI